MDKELKAKWIAALRSGKYKQTSGVLKAFDGSMCCLGVLRHVIDPSSEETLEESEYLSEHMAELAGLAPYQSDAGAVLSNPQKLLADQNDMGKSFAEIANIIEEKL
jgi:hypothetical protein